MFEAEQICPYTGLRSFTEDESLYFKGRDENIDQATEQLQRNKFLMLTGASGDGKSSLIYAGIIPNARAGFLKSKYSQWCVADFRPERTPFHNLCKAIARQLDIPNASTIQAELNHGFSAIIDLYRNSKRYIDTNSIEWKQADEQGKAALKRDAANLIILVDQFEEFFTNPENYHKGVPSGDANIVLNLLLETARIALQEDLPIYIVFTMRSDYIGQCAAFRGLPEYIGFSQFFVPRLNRTQLQQVIEEPSVLSGNRISRRLTERLIHDLTEGVDQLPILQHALNQIWHAADNGKEEMDLLHYAMVGGMPKHELPDDQVQRFEKWFENLPVEIKACYHKPTLRNVLDTHTNKLYELAAEYYARHTKKVIPDADAKAIIKTAFICLTKIDQSRAVRNRMTLKEITDIFGRPGYGSKDIGAVLNIFREPGNTFIRPFISDDPEDKVLNENDVLDITHESLIRNWQYLEDWAKEEYNNFTISLDFEQQLNRWVVSDKSNDFLLSIGPLTYFETWFDAAKPNAYWIARYLPEETDQESKLSKAKLVLGNAREFLSGSARKHVVTRTIMRYGPRRIVAALALLGVLTLSSFAVRDYFRKQNDYVLKSIKRESFQLANKPNLSLEFLIPPLIEQLIAGNVTVPEVINAINEPLQKIKIATGIATLLVAQGKYEPKKEINQSLTIADSLLEQLVIGGNERALSKGLKLIHDYSVTAGLANLASPDKSLNGFVTRNAERSARWALHIFKEQPKDFSDMQSLGLALENGINHKIYTPAEITQLLKILSPFDNTSTTPWLQRNFHRDNVLVRGGTIYGQRFNGLYQDLAYLYAAAGMPAKVLQCMDTLLRYQENFHQNDYATHIDNASNIAVVFHTYGTTDHLDTFVQGYCTRKRINAVEFYNRLVSRALIDVGVTGNTNFYAGAGGQEYSNLNTKFSSDQMLSFFFAKLKAEILKISERNERNLTMAAILKNEVILKAFRKETKGLTETENDQQYKNAISYFQQVSAEYLNEPVPFVGTAGSDVIAMPRKYLFLYPDYRVQFHPFEPRSIVQFMHSADFIAYVLDHNLFDSLYRHNDELKCFELWLLDYHTVMSSRDNFFREQVSYALLERLALKLKERQASQSVDLNILYLHLSEYAFDQKQPAKGIAYLQQVRHDRLLNAFQYKSLNYVNTYSFELVGKAISNLSANNQFELAYSFINVFKKEVNRSSLYAYASQLIMLNRLSPQIAQRLLDSARVEMTRLDNPAVFQPNRPQVAIALMYLDPEKNSAEAYRIIKNSRAKMAAMVNFSAANAFYGNLHNAGQHAPTLISSADKTFFLMKTIRGHTLAKPQTKEWITFQKNESIFTRRFLPYVNENQ